MGSFAEISLEADWPRARLLELSQALFAELDRLDAKYSFHRSSSVLSEVNAAAARAVEIALDSETAALIGQALRFSTLSDGLFDICVAPALTAAGALPGHHAVESGARWCDLNLQHHRLSFQRPALLDLGGIAKGYAIDCAFALAPAEVRLGINIGGDLRLSHWQTESLGLRGPDHQVALHTPMLAAAVASSVAAPGAHLSLLIDPRSSQASKRACSVSVFAESAMVADALTKLAVFSADPEHSWLERLWRAGAHALIQIDAERPVKVYRAPSVEPVAPQPEQTGAER
nr:FAD:protein FMN transferase [Pseudomarimonas arenosa]